MKKDISTTYSHTCFKKKKFSLQFSAIYFFLLFNSAV